MKKEALIIHSAMIMGNAVEVAAEAPGTFENKLVEDGPLKSIWAKGKCIGHVIENDIECVTHSLGVYDFDGDGNPDVFTAEMEQSDDPDEVRIYFNDGNGISWTKKVISLKGSHWNQFADIDTDGDIDIFGANHGSQRPPSVEIW